MGDELEVVLVRGCLLRILTGEDARGNPTYAEFRMGDTFEVGRKVYDQYDYLKTREELSPEELKRFGLEEPPRHNAPAPAPPEELEEPGAL